MSKVLVLYYSSYGHIETMAHALAEGARSAGLADSIVSDVLALDRPSTIPTTDAARLFPQYLAAVEQLARAVDAWRA